jgi:Sugar (and other) transporter
LAAGEERLSDRGPAGSTAFDHHRRLRLPRHPTGGRPVGSAALVVPLYLSEIAPTEVRGAITSLNQLIGRVRHQRADYPSEFSGAAS